MEQTAKRHRRMNLLIFLMPFLAVVFCIGIGRYHITPLESLKILISPFTGMGSGCPSLVRYFSCPASEDSFSVGGGNGIIHFRGFFSSIVFQSFGDSRYSGSRYRSFFRGGIGSFIYEQYSDRSSIGLAYGAFGTGGYLLISRLNGKSSILMVVLGGMVVSSLFPGAGFFGKICGRSRGGAAGYYLLADGKYVESNLSGTSCGASIYPDRRRNLVFAALEAEYSFAAGG